METQRKHTKHSEKPKEKHSGEKLPAGLPASAQRVGWQFFSLWYLGNIMMENQQLYVEKST